MRSRLEMNWPGRGQVSGRGLTKIKMKSKMKLKLKKCEHGSSNYVEILIRLGSEMTNCNG
jgi:hypothetical protein